MRGTLRRTAKDIQRDKANVDLQNAVIKLYEDYTALNITDICALLSKRLTSEIEAIDKHYIVTAKDLKKI